jgi:uncharacterized membrane protein
VFVPTTPNPTTGFLIIVPMDLVREVDMTIDEAFTYILSAGAVSPEGVRPPGAAFARGPQGGSTVATADRLPGTGGP